MKAHYPAELFCGLLNSQPMGPILETRQQAPFVSVAGLYARTSVESDGLVNLVKGGFLDGLDTDRGKMLAQTRRLPRKRRRKAGGQELLYPSAGWCERQSASLSASLEEAYLPPTAGQEERMEWEALGLNVGRHPLCAYRKTLRDLDVTPSREAWNLPHGAGTRVAGLLECMQRPPTRSGKPVYFLMIEDEYGLLQTTIFRSVYERYGHVLHQKSTYLLEGRVEENPRRGFSFVVEKVQDLGAVLDAGGGVPAAPAVPVSGAFVRAGRRPRRAG
jgi:error-prone DNA polymerase